MRSISSQSNHLSWEDGDLSALSDSTFNEDFTSSFMPEAESRLTDDEVESHKSYRALFTPAMNQAHAAYKWDSKENFNSFLRMAPQSPFSHHPSPPHVAHMDKVAGHTIGHDVNLYRGFGSGFKVQALKAGHGFIDHGFTGMTHSSSKAAEFAQNTPNGTVVGHIHVPEGTTGHLLDIATYGSKTGENEVVLGRGTAFHVTGHSHVRHPETGQKLHLVHMRVIGQFPRPLNGRMPD